MTSFDRRTLLRTTLGVTLGATTTIGLTGCGSSAGNGNGSLTVLTPIFNTKPGKKALEGRIVKGFHRKHPDAKVRVDYNTWDVLPEKITTGIAGGTLGDVIMVGFGWVPPFAEKGTLAELPDSLTGQTSYLRQISTSSQYLDKTYALPVGLDPNVYAYRKDHFEKAGISPPTSLADFRAAAKELARPKPGGGFERAGIDISSVNLRQMWCNVLDAAGGRMFDDEGKKVTFDGPQGERALTFLSDLVTDRSTSLSFRSTTPLQSLLKGTSSIMATAASAVGQVAVEMGDDSPELERIGYFVIEDKRPSLFVGGTLATVNKRSENQEAALAFVRELTAKKNSLAVSEPNGYIPPFTDVAADKALRNPAAPLIRDHLKHSVGEGGSPAWMEIREGINPAVEGVLTGKDSVGKALDSLRSQSEDAIGRI